MSAKQSQAKRRRCDPAYPQKPETDCVQSTPSRKLFLLCFPRKRPTFRVLIQVSKRIMYTWSHSPSCSLLVWIPSICCRNDADFPLGPLLPPAPSAGSNRLFSTSTSTLQQGAPKSGASGECEKSYSAAVVGAVVIVGVCNSKALRTSLLWLPQVLHEAGEIVTCSVFGFSGIFLCFPASSTSCSAHPLGCSFLSC